jgi:hypothetical protein
MINWKEFNEHSKPRRKGLYLVTIAYRGGSQPKTEAAYWNAYDKKKWTGFDINEDGEMCEVFDVIAYAEMPEPYLTK